ncbi:MAG: CDP-diacylglycerol--glycerol-3-phosphate 3-phosphatidyltransferase [Verrucomicrobiota bacterium]
MIRRPALEDKRPPYPLGLDLTSIEIAPESKPDCIPNDRGHSPTSMSLPNLLTLSRIPFLFLIAVCLFLPTPGPTFAFVLFLVAAITDWADGWLARKMNEISDFGKLMDSLADKILMVGMLVVLVSIDLLPPWTLFLVLLIITRELWITGLRLVAAARGIVLAAERLGKYKTVFQIVSIALLLLARAVSMDFSGGESAVANFVHSAGVICFILATALTVVSGAVYLWNYRGLMAPAGK